LTKLAKIGREHLPMAAIGRRNQPVFWTWDPIESYRLLNSVATGNCGTKNCPEQLLDHGNLEQMERRA
jgi:hypothetical protein